MTTHNPFKNTVRWQAVYSFCLPLTINGENVGQRHHQNEADFSGDETSWGLKPTVCDNLRHRRRASWYTSVCCFFFILATVIVTMPDVHGVKCEYLSAADYVCWLSLSRRRGVLWYCVAQQRSHLKEERTRQKPQHCNSKVCNRQKTSLVLKCYRLGILGGSTSCHLDLYKQTEYVGKSESKSVFKCM